MEKGRRQKMSSSTLPLQFAPFSSQIPSSFWSNLARVKVEKLQLSQESIPVRATYTSGRSVIDRTTGDFVQLPVGLYLDGEALERGKDGQRVDTTSVEVLGQLKNFNTVEDFKNADKGAILNKSGQELLSIIQTDTDPLQKLNRFILLSFADLKKFKFIYWLAYPALLAKPGWQVCSDWQTIDDVCKEEEVGCLWNKLPLIITCLCSRFFSVTDQRAIVKHRRDAALLCRLLPLRY